MQAKTAVLAADALAWGRWSGSWGPLVDAGGALLPVWAVFLLGLLLGQLLPRSRPWLARWGRVSLALHALVIVREVVHRIVRPGTLRAALRATIQWACGRGWSFQWPASVAAGGGGNGLLDAQSDASSEAGGDARGPSEWYVTEKDLAFFEYHAIEGGPLEGATPWELMFDKDVPGFVRYTAWRRTLPCGKAEYKSVTVAPDVTPQEFMDMYLDDAFRRNWDGMVIHHEVLEHGLFAERQQVVRWIRRFPFAFLSDREYAIARRLFRHDDGSLTACTKSVVHPREYSNSSVVRMDVFHSHWRSRLVECPWGSGKPATETTLLHHEQFKINERLARFAVTHGMWGFVRKLASTVPQYVEARRRRCDPHKEDPAAYGAGFAPNPPSRHGDHGVACEAGAGASAAAAGGEARRRDAYRPRKRALPKAVAVALIGGALIAAAKARGSGSQQQQQRRRQRPELGLLLEAMAEEGPAAVGAGAEPATAAAAH